VKLPLDEDSGEWLFIKSGEEYGLQYNGKNPDKEFPVGLTGANF